MTGDQVLVLLSESNKLLAKWMGPYIMTRKLTDVTYEILMQDKRKQRGVSHINMLAKWESPTAACLLVEIASEKPQVTDGLITWTFPEQTTIPNVNQKLTDYQQEGVWTILTEYRMSSLINQEEPVQLR